MSLDHFLSHSRISNRIWTSVFPPQNEEGEGRKVVQTWNSGRKSVPEYGCPNRILSTLLSLFDSEIEQMGQRVSSLCLFFLDRNQIPPFILRCLPTGPLYHRDGCSFKVEVFTGPEFLLRQLVRPLVFLLSFLVLSKCQDFITPSTTINRIIGQTPLSSSLKCRYLTLEKRTLYLDTKRDFRFERESGRTGLRQKGQYDQKLLKSSSSRVPSCQGPFHDRRGVV